MNKNIQVVMQSFYGNRTITEIKAEDFNHMLLGILDKEVIDINDYQIDRSIIKVPNTENIVIVFNKHQEEEYRQYRENDSEQHIPTVYIPEENIKLYSRCIVCRMNDDGCFESLQDEDFDKFMKYLTE